MSIAKNDAFAIDCEMCQMTSGANEVVRVSLVDYNSRTIIDEIVRPAGNVHDYNTKYHGITSEQIRCANKTLPDIQRELKTRLKPSTTLIGHDLECDLRALGISHANKIDTAVIFSGPVPGQKSALKTLAKEKLGRTIQTGYHDSVEDARTAFDVVKTVKHFH